MINTAVIGCGTWGLNHIRNIQRIEGCNLKAVADTDKSRLENLRLASGCVATASPNEIFSDNSIEAVVIAVPTGLHYTLVKQSLENDKHVLCEKPLCTKSDEAGELAEIAKQRGKVLMVGNTFLFHPGITKLKELIDSKEAGKLLYMTSVRTNLGPIRDDVSVIFDLCSHDVAIFNFLCASMPSQVSAVGRTILRKKLEDVVFATLTYGDLLIAHVEASWLNPKKVRQIVVVSENKMFTWNEFDPMGPVTIFNKGATTEPRYRDYAEFLRVSTWETDVVIPKVSRDEPLYLEDKYFIDCVRNGKAGKSDGFFGAEIVRVLEAIQRSVAQNGAPVEI